MPISNRFKKISHNKKFKWLVAILAVVFLIFVVLWLVKPSWHDTLTFNKPSHIMNVEKADFWLRIDKIKVKVPVNENVSGIDKNIYNQALKNGLAHYKGTSLPGGGSNIFIFGHSNNDRDTGPYKDVFARLNELEDNDQITIYYKGKYFKYRVVEKRVVGARETSVLNQTGEERLTLMTCWPVGTKDKRLVVTAGLDR